MLDSLPPLLPALGLAEPFSTAVFLAVVGALIVGSVVFSKTMDRLGVPVVLLFLVLGMIGGSEGIGRIAFNDYGAAVRLGTIALVLILFEGGLNTSIESVRQVLWPASMLATLGVIATAALLGVCGWLLGLGWREALLLGAVVSSTDAAAVFAVLRGGQLNLRPKVGRTLEVESCINDPMAVILTTLLIEIYSDQGSSIWQAVLMVPVQLAVGLGVGLGCGFLARWVLRRIRLGNAALYPALSVAVVFFSFGVATVAWGSGFLAVYVAGLILGNGPMPYRNGLIRVHTALAWLSQIGMFLMFGLLVFPSELLPIAGTGLGLGLLLAFVARPLAVLLLLAPFRYSLREMVYVAWIGLRGAVPIILGTFPVLAGVDGADRVFNLVFFIVVVSSLIPGATIRPVTRWLGLGLPQQPTPTAALEMNSIDPLVGELVSFYIRPSLAVCGAKLAEIEVPANAAVVLVVRNGQLLAARGSTRLDPGDHAYVFFRPEDRAYMELLFGGPEEA